MPARQAACHCGQLRLEVDRRSVRRLHLHTASHCQRRTGSAFGMQAGFKAGSGARSWAATATTRGSPTRRTRRSTSSTSAPTAVRRSSTRSRPSRIWSSISGRLVRRPRRSRRRPSRATTRVVTSGSTCPRTSRASRPSCGGRCHPLYESGSTRRRRTRGASCSTLIRSTPTWPTTSRAARASRAGRADAIEHLRLAIDGNEQFRAMATGDSDFDPIRDEPAFKELVG